MLGTSKMFSLIHENQIRRIYFKRNFKMVEMVNDGWLKRTCLSYLTKASPCLKKLHARRTFPLFGIVTAVWKAQLNEVKINVFIAPVNMIILSIVRQVSGCQKRSVEGKTHCYPSSVWFLKGAGPHPAKKLILKELILFKNRNNHRRNSIFSGMKIWQI